MTHDERVMLLAEDSCYQHDLIRQVDKLEEEVKSYRAISWVLFLLLVLTAFLVLP
ncbi:MAG: hypothetical protein ACXABY_06405 [Candidatus Thorarchaeota archaeon]|jgi:hypothetical protein